MNKLINFLSTLDVECTIIAMSNDMERKRKLKLNTLLSCQEQLKRVTAINELLTEYSINSTIIIKLHYDNVDRVACLYIDEDSEIYSIKKNELTLFLIKNNYYHTKDIECIEIFEYIKIQELKKRLFDYAMSTANNFMINTFVDIDNECPDWFIKEQRAIYKDLIKRIEKLGWLEEYEYYSLPVM